MVPRRPRFKRGLAIVTLLTAVVVVRFVIHNGRKEVPRATQTSFSQRVQIFFQLISGGFNGNRNRKDELMPRRTKLIILGYKSSGSSLTGAVITSHPEVSYYIYEPIWYIKDPDGYGISAGDRTVPLIKRIKEEFQKLPNPPEPLDMIKALHNCRLDPKIRTFIKYAGDSKEIQWLDGCVYRSNKSNTQACFWNLNKRCSQAKLTAMKTVRLSMNEAEELLLEDPDMKIVHVIRDPRGTQNSIMPRSKVLRASAEEYIHMNRKKAKRLLDQRRRGNFTGNVTFLNIRFIAHCRILTEDLQKSLLLSNKFKGRILTLRYEDLAEEPYRISTRLLNLLGLGMKPEVKKVIHSLMESGKKKAKTRGYIIKANSSAHASKWRGQIAFDVVETIQRDCGFVFKVLGYRLFSSEAELQDLYFPGRDKDYDHRLIKVI